MSSAGTAPSHRGVDERQPAILSVCTGNICRSPAAERLLAHAVTSGAEFSSAGTHALVGQPIEAPVTALLRKAGADVEGFAARRLTSHLVRRAALVLTMTREQRAFVVELWPGAVRRCFTLLEFARLCSAVPANDLPHGHLAERLPTLVRLAAAQRRPLSPGSAVDDIEDPYRRSAAVYDRAFADIARSVSALVPLLDDSRS